MSLSAPSGFCIPSSPTMDSRATDPTVLFNVEGQVAVVTGGGTGIGLLIAKALEHNGATVYIIGRRLEVLERAASEHSRYGRIIPLQGDVTSRQSLLAMVETIKDRHGFIDLLVNNAGIARNLLPRLPSPLDESAGEGEMPSIKALQDVLWNTGDPAGFAETFETNVTAVYYTTIAFLELLHFGNLRRGAIPPLLAARRTSAEQAAGISPGQYNAFVSKTWHLLNHSSLPPRASGPSASSTSNVVPGLPQVTSQVVTISSSGSFRVDARVLTISYTLAKQACTHLGRLLASLLAHWNIRSNVLCPGVWPSEMTNTDLFTPSTLADAVPLGRVGTLSDMAGCILFLAGPAGAYVNGAIWLVDGGRVNSVASSYNP
ncbi:NAD(P)-binding protein [Pisolithus albus]|nr:NAD(P)-binding protein [Pisolithus albus]